MSHIFCFELFSINLLVSFPWTDSWQYKLPNHFIISPPSLLCASRWHPLAFELEDCAKNKIDKIWLEVRRRCLGDRGRRIHGVSAGRHVCPGGPLRRLLTTKQCWDVSIRPLFPSRCLLTAAFPRCFLWVGSVGNKWKTTLWNVRASLGGAEKILIRPRPGVPYWSLRGCKRLWGLWQLRTNIVI